MTPRQLAMAAALVAAAGLAVFGDKTPESDVAEAVVRKAAPPSARGASARPASAAAVAAEPVIVALRPRAALIGEAGEFGGADAVFLSQNWTPPPPKAVAPPPPPPAPPPTAPPLPFIYIGKAAADGNWEVFLARGEKTYNAQNKTVIDGQYRVDTIVPPIMTLTYLPLNQVQQLNIGVPD